MAEIILNANNQSSSSDVFYKRVLYDALAYAAGQFEAGTPPGVQDYWKFERLFYGKVDPGFNGVSVDIGALKQVSAERGNILILAPVAMAFEKFKSYFTLPLRLGKLANGTPLSSPVAYKGFANPLNIYQEYAISLIESFNEMLFDDQEYYHILNATDYARHFFKFYFSRSTQRLLSYSSFHLSPLCSPMSSGLSIDIADLNPGDDAAKMEFISSPNFDFYKQAAINAGFLIDQNIPWRLHYDLKSPVNVEAFGTGILDYTPYVREFFVTNFSPSYRQDIEYIKNLLSKGYEEFFNKLPGTDSPCDEKRQPPGDTDFDNLFGSLYWVEQYASIKSHESGHPYVSQDLEQIKRNARNLTARSEEAAIAYIYQKFKMPWVSPNSFFYEKLRRQFQEKNDFSLDKFSEYVKIVVMNSIASMY